MHFTGCGWLEMHIRLRLIILSETLKQITASVLILIIWKCQLKIELKLKKDWQTDRNQRSGKQINGNDNHVPKT